MADQRRYTSVRLPRGEGLVEAEPRQISLDSTIIPAAQDSLVLPQTPVPGAAYNLVKKV